MSFPDIPSGPAATPPELYDPVGYPTTPGSPPAPPAPPLSAVEVQKLTAVIAKEFFTDSAPK